MQILDPEGFAKMLDQLLRELREEGISEVHYIGNLEKKLDFIPGFVTTPWMICGMGISK